MMFQSRMKMTTGDNIYYYPNFTIDYYYFHSDEEFDRNEEDDELGESIAHDGVVLYFTFILLIYSPLFFQMKSLFLSPLISH